MSNQNEMGDLNELDALSEAIEHMDMDEPPEEMPMNPEAPSAEDLIPREEAITSPTLLRLDETRRPRPDIKCAVCPNAVWFATDREVKCYCRIMYLLTWQTSEKTDIVLCDGTMIGSDLE